MTKLFPLLGTDRPPFRLATLEPHRDALEKCVYCPKLSRAACPVSNATPNETLTPWGKMSSAYFLARGDVPIDAENTSPLWACSGCMACRERCDHKNDVATALFDARAAVHAEGAAPAGVSRTIAAYDEREARAAERAARVASNVGATLSSVDAAGVLVGCGYHHLASDSPSATGEAIDELGVRATVELLGLASPRELSVVGACCGLPLLHAGDRDGFRAAAERFAKRVASLDPLVVIDPGCARAIATYYPRAGVSVREPTLFVDLAARSLGKLTPREVAPPRYHDPCQLGRGLGRFEAPRQILEKIAGQPPREFQRSGALGECSGGGGLLPVTMPVESDAIARARIAEHDEKGGGVLVTACAQSLRRFRASGAVAEDLVEWVARSLGLSPITPATAAPPRTPATPAGEG